MQIIEGDAISLGIGAPGSSGCQPKSEAPTFGSLADLWVLVFKMVERDSVTIKPLTVVSPLPTSFSSFLVCL